MEATATVVVPSWNGRELLEPCLAALRGQTGAPPFEIIVVDNGSQDGTAGWLAASRPDVRLVALPENRGFAAAVNAGIGAARGELVALLNNDTEPEPGWLGALAGALAENPGFSFAASKILRMDDRSRIDACGDGFSVHGFAFKRGAGQPDGARFARQEEVALACAGAALYRKRVLEDVGPFEERFFAYFEDSDWSLRARLRGHRCLFVPGARVYHKGGATAGRMADRTRRLQARNAIYLLLGALPGPVLRRALPGFVMTRLVLLLQDASRSQLRATLGGYAEALGDLKWIWERRRAILRSRRVDDKSFAEPFERSLAGNARSFLRDWLRSSTLGGRV